MNRRQFGITAALAVAATQLAPLSAEESPLTPLAGIEAPVLDQKQLVQFVTDVGEMTFAIYPQAAPNAAKRFLELVSSGFYDNTPIFRVVPGFVAQFGINWRPKHKDWKENNFKDDPSLFKLDEGTLAFAKAGKDTNSCQVFINYGENSRLAKNGGFSTFGKVVSNFDVAKKFKSVGDPGMGLDQDWLWSKGEAYLDAISEKPNMIIKASLVPAS